MAKIIGNMRRAVPKPPVKEEIPVKAEPKGLPKPIAAAPQKQEDPDMTSARTAVATYENEHRVLKEMKEDWEKNFPEANAARNEIMEQEDRVVQAIAKAKILIAKVKQSIGEFTAQRKYKKAHYDETEVMRVLTTLENRLEIFDEMLTSGIVSTIGLNREAALAWFAQRPRYSVAFQAAFKEQVEDTTAVTVPKL